MAQSEIHQPLIWKFQFTFMINTHTGHLSIWTYMEPSKTQTDASFICSIMVHIIQLIWTKTTCNAFAVQHSAFSIQYSILQWKSIDWLWFNRRLFLLFDSNALNISIKIYYTYIVLCSISPVNDRFEILLPLLGSVWHVKQLLNSSLQKFHIIEFMNIWKWHLK